MMAPVARVNGRHANARDGTVSIDCAKSLWIGSHLAISIFIAPFFFEWSAVAICLGLAYVTLLLGHSVGMHRMMIHNTFKAPPALERSLIYVGTLIGLAGPFGTIAIHDVRDWAQRQESCHSFFSHKRSFLKDLLWQLFYRFNFDHAPVITVERRLANDPYLSFFEKTWRWHQVLLTIPLYWVGGMSWVIWGVSVRISLSVIGHWTVTYFCHNPGPSNWVVKGVGVQASHIPFASFITHGECWHDNHHAFPESARIGLYPGQRDTAWLVICALRKISLAYDVQAPRPKHMQSDLVPMLKRTSAQKGETETQTATP